MSLLDDDAKTNRTRIRSTPNPHRDENIFKIPNALPPRQASPKNFEPAPRAPTINRNEPQKLKAGQLAAIVAAATAASTTAPPTPAFDTIFRANNHNKASDPNLFASAAASNSSKNSSPFSLTSVVHPDKSSAQPDVTDSKSNMFKSAAAAQNTYGAKSNNMFALPFSGQNAPASSSNTFSLPLNKPSSGSNIFSEAAASNPTPPTNIFGSFNQSAVTQNSTFGSQANNHSNNVFGGSNNVFGAKMTFNNQSSKLSAPSAASATPFGSFNSTSIAGITPLSSQNTDTSHARRLAADAQRNQQEAARKLAAEVQKRAEQKRLDDDRERQRVETKQKQLAHIESMSIELCSSLVDELVAQVCAEMTQDELIKRQAFEQNATNLQTKLINEVVAELLLKITDDLLVANQNIMRKFFSMWQLKAIEQIENRRKIETTPIWMPPKAMPEQIPELQHPLQNTTLSSMKRYRLGVPFNIKLPAIKEHSIDLWKSIVSDIQRAVAQHEQPNRRHFPIRSHVYWKCLVSVPDASEDINHESINRWLSRTFVRRHARRNDIFFVEQNGVGDSTSPRVSVCLRKVSGSQLIDESNNHDCTEAIRGANAVLFFMAAGHIASAKRRLMSIIQKTGIRTAIGIVTYNSAGIDASTIQRELAAMPNVLSADTIGKCLFIDRGHEPLTQLTTNCLQYIAGQSQFNYRLELQCITSFLQLTLGDELWQRIASTLNQNPTLSRAITDFNFVANFHNEALKRIISICEYTVDEHTQFADEFRPFVPDIELDIPLELEYFPNNWRTTYELHRKQLCEFMRTLALRPFDVTTITNATSLEHTLLAYASQHFTSDRDARQAAYKMLQPILMFFNQPSSDNDDSLTFTDKLSAYPWIKSVELLALDMLTHRYNDYIQKQRLPGYVIYDKSDLAKYIQTPWWLTLKKNLLREITTDVLNESVRSHDDDVDESPTSKKRRMNNSSVSSPLSRQSMSPLLSSASSSVHSENHKINIDELLVRGRATLERVDRKIAAIQQHKQVSKETSRQFDHHLYKQEQTIRVMKNVWEQHLQ